MAWNTPTTQSAGATMTATIWNAQVRDNFKAIGDAWTSYTPAWSSSGTQPVLNNGTSVGAWLSAGKLVHFRILITMGSTTTYGTGTYRFTVPTAALSLGAGSTINIAGLLTDTGTAIWGVQACRFISSTTIELLAPTATADARLAVVAATVPYTFANTDIISISGTYEAA